DIVNCPNRNDWGLTYDDGPSKNSNGHDTLGVLQSLKSLNWKATFFIVGSNLMNMNDVLIQTHLEGHEVGIHTWSHHPLTSLTNEQIVAEIKYTEALIYQTIGVIPKYLRPPYGDIDDRVRAIVSALGYRTVLWSRDSGDTGLSNSALANILSWNQPDQPGFISLQHDLSGSSSNIAIRALGHFQSYSVLPFKPQPVGSCIVDSTVSLTTTINTSPTYTVVVSHSSSKSLHSNLMYLLFWVLL
ncbi:hypothetical protein BC833DRAFT_528338, partial [Globomyces pollinis-pini]